MRIKKILILGSGALKIGEAGEFDYSGSQAIKALQEEKIETVLVNPNIATIQTSKFLADKVYFLPVNSFFVEKIIAKERPGGILLSFGGQTALNCGVDLYKNGILKKYGVKILGTPISAIILTEDRKKFAEHLKKINIPTPKSFAAKDFKEALEISKKITFPFMVRSGFALGGQGSGIAKNENEFKEIAQKALSFSSQILLEQYLHHFKEIEYEVVRDSYDNCITVCNMENMDPLGIHTGESIVVAPSQTLNNFEYQALRNAAIKIVRGLNIVGECNVQFALNPKPENQIGVAGVGAPRRVPAGSEADRGHRMGETSDRTPKQIDYYVIEVNARLSRSSALASKATGYPLAYVAAKLSLGKNLTEIKNKVTQITQACFEPSLDYIVVKIPRWDIEKFKGADEKIGSSMKSVGEVMGIGRTFEEAYQKAIRMLDLDFDGGVNRKFLKNGKTTEYLLGNPTPKRMFAIAQALLENMPVEKIYKTTGIDPWFIERIKNIVDEENNLRKTKKILDRDRLLKLKQLGFSDKYIGEIIHTTGLTIRKLRKKYKIIPSILQIDTLSGEFEAKTNYLYSSYNAFHNDVSPLSDKGVIVLGSGPYRIGSSVEFDWTSVNTALSLKSHNKKSIMVNCNPETVSTDYDISDRLYFEELTFERIADIYDFEKSYGIIISMGGQTPNNRALSLKKYGARILGTDAKDINRAEDRNKFSDLLDKLQISQPAWNKFSSSQKAIEFCKKVGFPVIIRPSFVLSGTLMRICHTQEDLITLLKEGYYMSKDYPVTISKFVEDAKEIELDAVSQKGRIIYSVISEHIENAGVHSGDASIVLPPQKLYLETQRQIEKIAKSLAEELGITGPFNIQFLAKDNKIQVIEVNLRSSRTFPFISKATGVNLIDLCANAFFGKPQNQLEKSNMNFVAVKVAQFSFARINSADPILHVEMTSTGEVACFGKNEAEAFLKSALSVGAKIPQKGIFISLGGPEKKIKFLEAAKKIVALHLPIFATKNTAQFLKQNGVKTRTLHKLYEKKSPNISEYFRNGRVDLAINLTDRNFVKNEIDDYQIRRLAIDYNIPLYTNRQKAELFIQAITANQLSDLEIKEWSEYV